MRPLGMADAGEQGVIGAITGSPDLIRCFDGLNLRVGSAVTVLDDAHGCMRLALEGGEVVLERITAMKLLLSEDGCRVPSADDTGKAVEQ